MGRVGILTIRVGTVHRMGRGTRVKRLKDGMLSRDARHVTLLDIQF